MRPYSARAVQTILLTGILLLILVHAPVPPPARAGEALFVGSPGFGSPGAYVTWAQGVPIGYTVDGGNFGVYNNATAEQLFVTDMFALWAGVPTANLSFTDNGPITSGSSGGCVVDGDVDTSDNGTPGTSEYDCLSMSGFPGNPIIFDVDGSLIDALRGAGASDSILGFAGPRTTGNSMSASHTSGHAVLNGKFVDGVAGTETSEENMQATALHEYGHFLGLGHSQINDHCLQALQNMTTPCANGSDDAFGLPTMYPISFSLEEAPNPPSNMPTAPAELTLSMDDMAWISLLYPGGTFAANYNTISGQLLTSDGLGPIQGGNVIARQLDDPATAGIDESLRCAVSVVSGDRFTLNLGQNVSGDNPPPPDPNAGMFFPSTGSHDPTLYGAFVIPVPNAGQGGPAACAAASAGRGMYTLQGETINSVFTGGSSVGPHGRFLGAVFPIPGTPTTLAGTLDATTGSVSNADISLNGTNPSSDGSEGGARNDTVATAAPIGNGTNAATISPMLPTGPDQDVYSFTAIANQTVTLNINAEATYTTFLDSVIEIVDGNNTRVNLCDTVTPGVFTGACMNDDDPAGGTLDSFLQFQSPTAGTFYVRVLDWRGDARVDFMYDLVVLNAGTPLSAPGCTKDFDNGGGNSDWNTATNWNPDGVPTASDDVCIGAFTVNSSGANTVDTIANLTAGGALNITGGTLTATTSILINGGTLTLSGGAVSTGTVNLTSGVLQGSGSLTGNIIQDGGTYGAGTSAGVINHTGDFTQNAGGTVLFEIFGTSGAGAATGHDQINITGSAAQNGTVNVVLDSGYMPTLNDTFTLATFATDVGSGGGTLNLPDISAFGFQFVDIGGGTDFTIQVQALAGACTRTFTNGGTNPGAWEDPDNWNPVGVPTGADDACIDADQFSVVVIAAGQGANSLTVTGTANVFLLAAGSLNLAAPSSIAGPFTIGAGTLDGTGDLTIGGTFIWAGGTMQGTGVTTANGGMNLTTTANKVLDNGRTLNNTGMATWADGEFFIGNGAVFNNTATGVFDIQHTGTRNLGGGVGGASTVNNAGTMTKSAGGGLTVVNAGFNNTGTLNANDGTFRLISAANPSTSTGAFNVGAGTLEFNNGTYDLNSGATVTGAGTITIPSGNVNFNNGSSLTTAVSQSGGVLTLATGGTVTLPTLTQTGGTVTGTGILDITGVFTWSGGDHTGTGTTNANGGMTLSSGNNKILNNGRTLNNPGMATWADGEFFIGNGAVFNNTATGVFDIQHTGTRNLGGGVGGASTVNNAGTMTKSAGGGLTAVNAGFNNTGTLNANDGTFRLISAANPSTSTGAFNVGAGTLEFNNGTYDLNSGATVTGAGTITIPSGNVNFNNGSSLTTAVSQSGGVLTLATGGTVTLPTLTQTGGTVTGTGILDITGVFTWSGGDHTGMGTTNANGGMTLSSGNNKILNNGRTLNNPGMATWSDGEFFIGNGAVFNNTATGVFDIQHTGTRNLGGGVGGASTVNNAGTMTKSAGGGLTAVNAGFNNTGTLNANDGTFRLISAANPSTSTGAFNVGAGTLEFNNGTYDLNSGATVSGAGTITIPSGNVNFNNGSSLTTAVSQSGGVLTLATGGTVTLPTLTQSGGTVAGTDLLNITGAFTWSGGVQQGAGGVTNANGGMTLSSGNNKILNNGRTLNNPGMATWSDGEFFIGNGAVFNNTATGVFDIQHTGTRNLGGGVGGASTVNNAGTMTKSAGGSITTVNAGFANTGTLNVNAGTMNFSNSFTQTAGLTRLNGGNLGGGITFNFNGGVLDAVGGSTITGNVNIAGATLRPGMSPGILNISGNYTQGPTGVLDIELGGTTPGTGFDVLAITGSATLGGTLNVLSFGGFTPVSGDNFAVMTYASFTGDFAVKNGLNISTPALTATPQATFYLLSVPAQADLAVTKTDAADPVLVGENISYTVTVTNNGPSAANNVTLTDTLPAGVTFVSATAPCTEAGGTVTCNLGVLANGANTVITIVVTPGAPGMLSNTASVTTSDTDPNLADNSATETTTVNQAATTTVVTSSVNPSVFGENVTFTATVTVNAPGAGTPTGTVDFFDGAAMIGSGTLNAGGMATFATSTLGVGAHNITATYNGDTNFTTSTSAPLVQNVNQAATTTAVVSSVNPSVFGENVTFTATVTVNAPGAGTPTGTVDFFDGAAMIGSGTLNAGGMATFATSTLSVGAHTITATYNGDTNFTTSTSAPLTQNVNQASTSTALVSSLNPSNTGDNVTFTATVTAVAPGAGTPTGTVDFFDGAVLLGSGTLNAGGVATFSTSTLTVGTHPITATYNGDTNFATSTSAPVSQVVNGVADLSVAKSDAGSDPVNVGQNIVYTVTVANGGPDPANNVVLTDTLPVAVTFVSAVPSQGGPCTLMGVTVTCPLGTINNGATANVVITVTAGVLAAPSVTNTASVTTSEIDPNAANDTVMETTTVNPVADLALTKTDSPDPVVISNNITYTLTVTNNGPSPATGIVVDDPLPANVTFVSVTAPAGSTCTTPAVGATGTVNCALPGMLASGANVAIMIVVQAPATAGTVNNTATVTSAITDPNAANNTATADTTVSTIIPSTDFSLTAVPINNNVIVGQTGTYTVTVGPLPAGTSFTSPISLACMSPTGTCTIAPNSLTPGANPASATMTVETAALLGSAPPAAPGLPEPGQPVSPVFALWTFLAGLMLVSLGYVGKKTQRRQLAHCMTFGLVLLVIAGAVGQSACGTRVRRQVSGPYTVTVTATSGALSHSTTVTLNVTQP